MLKDLKLVAVSIGRPFEMCMTEEVDRPRRKVVTGVSTMLTGAVEMF